MNGFLLEEPSLKTTEPQHGLFQTYSNLGESYFDCTTEDDTRLWCSLTKNYDQDLKKGYCLKTSDPQHQSSDTREMDEEEVLALQQQQALTNKLDSSATIADQKLGKSDC